MVVTEMFEIALGISGRIRERVQISTTHHLMTSRLLKSFYNLKTFKFL